MHYWTSYVVPKHLIAQYSRHSDYKDCDYAGHFELRSISSVRLSLLNEGYSLDEIEDDLESAAKMHSGNWGNPVASNWGDYKLYDSNFESFGYDDFMIPVIVFNWKDIELKKHKYTNTKGGTKKVDSVDANYTPDENEQKDIKKGYVSIKDTYIRVAKKATWVVDTDLIFDYGNCNFVPRPNKTDVDLDYHIFQIDGNSIVKQLKPILDQMQLAWLRYQNSVATALEPTTAIDMGMLANLYNGKNNADPLQLIKFMKDTGLLLHAQSQSGVYGGGATVPIQQLPGGMGTRLQEFITTLDALLRQIEVQTGLTELSGGTTPSNDTPVGLAEMSLQGTSFVLKPIVEAAMQIKEMSAPVLCKRILLAVNADKKISDSYASVIGESGIDMIKRSYKDKVELAFNFIAKPSVYEKQQFLQVVQDAYTSGKSGGDNGIFIDAYTRILEEMNAGGNLKKLYKILRSEVKRYERKRQENVERNTALQQQGNAQLAEAKAKEERDKIQGEYLKESALLEQKLEMERELEKEKARLAKDIGLFTQPKDPKGMQPEGQMPMQPDNVSLPNQQEVM